MSKGLEYAFDCPICDDGSHLFGRRGGAVSCEKGHSFASLEAAQNYAAPVQDMDSDKFPEDPHETELPPVTAGQVEPDSITAIGDAIPEPAPVEAEPCRCESKHSALVQITPQTFAAVGEGSVLEFPGGDVLIGLRIPESAVVALRAAAEELRMGFAEYVQQQFTSAVECGWLQEAGAR